MIYDKLVSINLINDTYTCLNLGLHTLTPRIFYVRSSQGEYLKIGKDESLDDRNTDEGPKTGHQGD